MENSTPINSPKSLVMNIMNVGTAVISLFLALRIFLKVVVANPSTPIVSFIYSVSQFFLNPFRGIFPDKFLNNGSVLDITAFIALFTYVIIAYILFTVLNSFVVQRHPNTVETIHTHIQ